MNPWAEPVGITLIVVALGAAIAVVAARNHPKTSRRWVAGASAVLAALTFGLVALLAYSLWYGIGELGSVPVQLMA